MKIFKKKEKKVNKEHVCVEPCSSDKNISIQAYYKPSYGGKRLIGVCFRPHKIKHNTYVAEFLINDDGGILEIIVNEFL